jgi:hypothetical protein
MMALTKRKSAATSSEGIAPSSLLTSQALGDDKNKEKNTMIVRVVMLVIILIAFVYATKFESSSVDQIKTSSVSLRTPLVGSNGKTFDIHDGIKLVVDMTGEITLGPHKAVLMVKRKDCPNLGFWLRLEGDALDTVYMKENGDTWEGSFSFPIPGSYSLIGYWNGCDNEGPEKKVQLFDIVVTGKIQAPSSAAQPGTFYPKSAWISSKKFNTESDAPTYIWHNPAIPTIDANFIKSGKSLVTKEGAIFPETKWYDFHKLSNYELVCWVGSQSAADLRTVFLEEKNSVTNNQRPFKFHIYNMFDFVHPDETWPEGEKGRFRKCKHILISLDETKVPLSQKQYAEQVTTFLQHLVKAFPDETFPIWMFTVSESPMKPTKCQPPYYLPRTSDHPCNDVLKDLFDSSKKIFPERVNLLDNSPISLPQLGQNRDDVAAAIALRIFVFVGKKVQEWRASGQYGAIDGLHRYVYSRNITQSFLNYLFITSIRTNFLSCFQGRRRRAKL